MYLNLKRPYPSVSSDQVVAKRLCEEQNEFIAKLELLLKKSENDDAFVILDIKKETANEPGKNYQSIMTRIEITGKLGDQSLYHKTFIRKVPVINETLKASIRSDDLFRTEAYVYENALSFWGAIGPKCILASRDEIILEDLCARQFKVCEIERFFDLDHCLAVLQLLTSMHAKSLSLKLADPESFKSLIAPLTESISPNDDSLSLGTSCENGIAIALQILFSINTNDPKVERAINFLLYYQNNVVATMKNLMIPEDGNDKYWVITHGDLWKDNMFHYDNDTGRIFSIKMFDFQMTRYASPALDFIYFLYTSIRPEDIRVDLDSMIAEYETFFLHSLRCYNVYGYDLVPFTQPGWFAKELKQYGLLGLFTAFNTIHTVFIDKEWAQLYEQCKISEVFIPSVLTDLPEKNEKILFMIDHFITHFANNS
ncbi:uncharacterized protein LOC131674220 isoform X1 [Phymastichus coffea]|uniref:uncharacterized protein LOC131674220 isoform X1 n=2 Tax=Phymastichus coffea TaxID=108790 RepID=UPI00273B5538|nr:uncharacterized protein LOC131674220 isoform X1 [Phymastichus coffea]